MLPRVRTHYDNLKVARNAPSEVIRAAYKTLSQKYHPDRNPGDQDASRIMQMLNEAYTVLSDEDKRRAHDEWIAAQEEQLAREYFQSKSQHEQVSSSVKQANAGAEKQASAPINGKPPSDFVLLLLLPVRIIVHLLRFWRFYILVGICVFVGVEIYKDHVRTSTYRPSPAPASYTPKPQTSNQAQTNLLVQPAKPVQPACVAMPKAPNGNAWPASAGYVKGEPVLAANGLSTVTIDNTKAGLPIFVKLKKVAGNSTIRSVYIPAGQKFTMNKVDPGTYFMAYKDVKNGCNYKSQSFELRQIKEYGGTRYDTIEMTIYTVAGGNMRYQKLPETDF